MEYAFDRFLRHDELNDWLDTVAAANPALVSIETYGRSHEGRDLRLVTITDTATGAHDTKPAHWVDASIHSVELTATVAACRLIRRLVDGHAEGDDTITRALATRTFYVVPRVNPDGAEWALADRPRFRRSSVRSWPYDDGHRWPGLHREDVDGDGRILQMRLRDDGGQWMSHPDDERLLVPIPFDGPPAGIARYRLLTEGTIQDFDGFSIPAPRPPEGLDLNRNFPAGWGRTVAGSGDHPLSEPEIDALVRAIAARPNICGYNAFHTSGGVLLRPSSTQPDSKLPPGDVWVWNRLAERGTALTGYPAHSVYEDFTWNTDETMSGAADDWAYEHLGIFGWTTEFWDVIHAATGEHAPTTIWYTGPSDAEALAVLRWFDTQPAPADPRHAAWVDWYEFDHPQLGPVELGGWNHLHSWTNPPAHRLLDEVDAHADFAVAQALAAPCVEIVRLDAARIAADDEADPLWRVDVGVANTGWLATNVSARALADRIVLPVEVAVAGDSIEVVDGPSRRQVGQLAGAMSARFDRGFAGSPERASIRFTVRAPAGADATVTVSHQRAGRRSASLMLR